MNISIATTDAEIAACYPVMRELRPQIAEEHFLSLFRRQESSGYRLAFVQAPEGVVAVAGFRVGENLAWGRFLYVDDLVTHPAHRSKGYGSRLLSSLKTQFKPPRRQERQGAPRFCRFTRITYWVSTEIAKAFVLLGALGVLAVQVPFLGSWLKAYAVKEGCLQLHLDSGIQRKEAHRFYEREGMTVAGLHFVENLAPIE